MPIAAAGTFMRHLQTGEQVTTETIANRPRVCGELAQIEDEVRSEEPPPGYVMDENRAEGWSPARWQM